MILKFSQRSVTVFKKIENYSEARVKLTNTKLNKVKSAAKNKTGIISRLIERNFKDEELPHESFITGRQATKIRNTLYSTQQI